MRIALVVPVFPQLSETFVAAKALGLLDRGHDLHVVCAQSSECQWAAYGPDHPVHRLRGRVHLAAPSSLAPGALRGAVHSIGGLVGHPSVVARYLRDVTASPVRRARELYLDAALVELEPEVVHFEFGSLALGRTAIRERLGCALTVSFRGHDLNFVGLDDPDHLCEIWARADGIHLVSQDLWRRALTRGAWPELPHRVIPPAVDARAVRPPMRRGGCVGSVGRPLRVLSVGRLTWVKGYDYALDAIADLVRRGIEVRYRIVGTGELADALGFWRHRLGLEDQVELVGAVSPGAVAEHGAWADVLLHAAISEGFCNAVLEAQAQALPVVTSDGGGLPENVAHGVSGLVVPRRDAVALADGLAGYAANPDARASAGAAGRDRALAQFGIEQQLNGWEEFYGEAVERRRVCP